MAKGRRTFKCWAVAFVCLATKAVSLLACPGYSTAVFIEVFNFFIGIYGKPRLVYTDHAPSLIRAAETHDWGEIAAAVGANRDGMVAHHQGVFLAEWPGRAHDPVSSPHSLPRAHAGSSARLSPVRLHSISRGVHPELLPSLRQDYA